MNNNAASKEVMDPTYNNTPRQPHAHRNDNPIATKMKCACTCTWKLVLLVDKQELTGCERMCPEKYVDMLNERVGLYSVERRTLPVGDYLWIVRRTSCSASSACAAAGLSCPVCDGEPNKNELILPWVVERKTHQNVHLSLSVKSKTHAPLNELQAQHQNMIFSGIANRQIWLERDAHVSNFGRTSQKLKEGILSGVLKDMQAKDSNLTIRRTNGIHQTLEFLAQQYESLQREYLSECGQLKQPKTNLLVSFETLHQRIQTGFSSPTFQWYLALKKIRGMSEDRVACLCQEYSTHYKLRHAFVHFDSTLKNIAKLKPPNAKRALGPQLARALQDLVMDSTQITNHTNKKLAPRALQFDSGDDDRETAAATETGAGTSRKRSVTKAKDSQRVEFLEFLSSWNSSELTCSHIKALQKSYLTKQSLIQAFEVDVEDTTNKIAKLKVVVTNPKGSKNCRNRSSRFGLALAESIRDRVLQPYANAMAATASKAAPAAKKTAKSWPVQRKRKRPTNVTAMAPTSKDDAICLDSDSDADSKKEDDDSSLGDVCCTLPNVRSHLALRGKSSAAIVTPHTQPSKKNGVDDSSSDSDSDCSIKKLPLSFKTHKYDDSSESDSSSDTTDDR